MGEVDVGEVPVGSEDDVFAPAAAGPVPAPSYDGESDVADGDEPAEGEVEGYGGEDANPDEGPVVGAAGVEGAGVSLGGGEAGEEVAAEVGTAGPVLVATGEGGAEGAGLEAGAAGGEVAEGEELRKQ